MLEAEVLRLRRRLDAAGLKDARPGSSATGTDRGGMDVADERLALAFDAADAIGWWDWDIPADRLRASPAFAAFFGHGPGDAEAGLPVSAYTAAVHPDDKAHVEARLAAVLAEGGETRDDYRVIGPRGAPVWILARGRCTLGADGRPLRYVGVALDIDQRKASDARKSALVELGDSLRDVEDVGRIAYLSAEVMARALGATRAGFGVVDSARETVMMQPDWRVAGTASLEGLHRFRDYGSFIDDLKGGEPVIIGDVTSDPRTADQAEALIGLGIRVLVNVPIMERGRFVLVVFVHHDRPHAWSGQELAFVRNVADRAQAAIARLRAEEERRLLNREIGHRLKNNLAMVQAIVAQTLRNAPDLETARGALGHRLGALAHAHDMLLSGEAGEADVAAVIAGALSLHDDGQERIALDGPTLDIAASAAMSLALMLHELATNAAKYGALSVPDGRVRVAWRIDSEAEDIFVFSWRESGGPPVLPPTRRGFGSRLIERGLAGAAGGSVRLDFQGDGFVCELSVPFAVIVKDG